MTLTVPAIFLFISMVLLALAALGVAGLKQVRILEAGLFFLSLGLFLWQAKVH